MDKFRAMSTFVDIVETGSLTAAAEHAGTSLTSVVRSLSKLEAQLGIRLLNRTTRRMALTDEGRDYFIRCRHILAELEEAEAALSARQREPTGTLRLTAPVMFGRLHVAPVVAAFLASHPSMRIELLLLDRVVDLLEEGMDAAIRIGPLADSSLVAATLGRTRRVVCASPDYLAHAGRPHRPADLAGHRCIRFHGLPPSAEWEFSDAGKTARVAIDGVVATNQVDAAIAACVQGLGCGMFLGYQVGDALTEGRLERVLAGFECPPVPVSLLYPGTRLLPPRVRAFLDWAVPRLRERIAGGL